MRITRSALVISGAVMAGLGIAACGPTVSRTATPPGTSAPATAPAEPSSAPAPTDPVTTGPLGTSFTVTTTDNGGNPVTYTVTATKVDQHAGLTPYETLQDPAGHMAAVRFTVTGVTGQESDDANSDATVTGNDTTEYQFSAVSVTDGPNFNAGEFHVGPGQTVSGWVAFELPAGATVASVSWQPGFEGPAATWNLGS